MHRNVCVIHFYLLYAHYLDEAVYNADLLLYSWQILHMPIHMYKM